MNEETLVGVHCWAGDQHLVEAFRPQYEHHACPVVVLSPSDSPVVIPGMECRSAGKRGYFGQDSLDRQREHLKILLEYPAKYFLLNDSDSMCLSPEIPAYLYENADNTLWSNEAKEGRPHPSPYPKIGLHPPYFLTRETIEKLLAVGPMKAHSVTPFIDWLMIALASEAGVQHRSYPDGKSFPAWKHGAIPETKELGHDYVHEETRNGVDGGRRMAMFVKTQGVVFVHSVKHPHVRDELVEAYENRRKRTVRPRPVPIRPQPTRSQPLEPGDLSILVAFREDSRGQRTRLWDFIRARLEQWLPEAEIVVGTDDGEDPFHKTLAINRAAHEATGNVFAIWDSDTWTNPDNVRNLARTIIEDPTRWGRPWVVKLKLNEAATDHVLSLGESWDQTVDHKAFGRPEHRNTYPHAPPLLLHREAFETVHGMPEAFRGWSSEDEAFARTLHVLVGRPITGQRGEALHLWHPRIGRTGKDLWEGQESDAANRELGNAYRRARTPEAMRKLIEPVRV